MVPNIKPDTEVRNFGIVFLNLTTYHSLIVDMNNQYGSLVYVNVKFWQSTIWPSAVNNEICFGTRCQ